MTDIKVFSKEWFKKYNKWIVKLAKLPFIGEWVFCFKKYGHYFDIDNLLEVQPNAVVEDMKLMWTKCVKVKGQWVAYDCTNKLHNRLIKKECKEKLLPTRRNHYFVRNEYALRLQKVFYPIWITFHIWDIITRPIPQLNLGFDTLTVYPGSNGTDDPVDGDIRLSGQDETFSNMRSTASGTSVNLTYTAISICVLSSSTNNQYARIYRGIAMYDTSGLTADATISSVVNSVYGSYKTSGFSTNPDLHVAQGNAASSTTLAVGDYAQSNHGTTSFGSKSYATYSDSSYNDITFNTSGIAAVSKTGLTKLSYQSSWDITNTPPTWADNKGAFLEFRQSNAGTNKPKLVVTYTLAVTFIPRTMWF